MMFNDMGEATPFDALSNLYFSDQTYLMNFWCMCLFCSWKGMFCNSEWQIRGMFMYLFFLQSFCTVKPSPLSWALPAIEKAFDTRP